MVLFCCDYKSRATTTPCYFYKKALESETSHPDGEEIKKLAEALHIPIEELLPDVMMLKIVQQNQDQSHSNKQHVHSPGQHSLVDELLSTQKDLIEYLKYRLAILEAENARLRQNLPN